LVAVSAGNEELSILKRTREG